MLLLFLFVAAAGPIANVMASPCSSCSPNPSPAPACCNATQFCCTAFTCCNNGDICTETGLCVVNTPAPPLPPGPGPEPAGTLLWAHPTYTSPSSAPLVRLSTLAEPQAGGSVINLGHFMTSFDMFSGALQFNVSIRGTAAPWANPLDALRVTTSGRSVVVLYDSEANAAEGRDAKTGARLWTFPIPGTPTCAFYALGDVLLLGGDTSATGINVDTGAIAFQDPELKVVGCLATAKHFVVVDTNNTMIAIDPSSGEFAWTQTIPFPIAATVGPWIVAASTLVVQWSTSNATGLQAYSPATGAPTWKTTFTQPSAAAVAFDDALFVVSSTAWQFQIEAIDLEWGTVQWVWTAETAGGAAPPSLVDGYTGTGKTPVAIVLGAGGLSLLSIGANGGLEWNTTLLVPLDSNLVRASGRLYGSSTAAPGSSFSYDAGTGLGVWLYLTQGPVPVPPTVVTVAEGRRTTLPIAFIASEDYFLYAVQN